MFTPKNRLLVRQVPLYPWTYNQDPPRSMARRRGRYSRTRRRKSRRRGRGFLSTLKKGAKTAKKLANSKAGKAIQRKLAQEAINQLGKRFG